MKDSCIVAPIHLPYFNSYGIDFVKSYNKYFLDSDLFLIFSSEEEKIIFEQIAKNLRYNSIVCTEALGVSPITQKKYFGIKKIFETTNFINVGCFDVDTLFVCQKDYDKLFKNYMQNKIYFANKISGLNHVKIIIKYPSTFYSDMDQNELKNVTEEFSLYFWFNDIPIYEKTSYINFLNYINYESNKYRLTYETFDYILYGYYMILKEKFKIKKISHDNIDATHDYGFLEGQHIFDKEYFLNCFNFINPMWIKTDINSPMENVFVKLHVHSPYK
jgi:hypothetical protein